MKQKIKGLLFLISIVFVLLALIFVGTGFVNNGFTKTIRNIKQGFVSYTYSGEVKKFNEKYYTQGWIYGVHKDFRNTLDQLKNTHGRTFTAETKISTTNIPKEMEDYLTEVKNVKTEHKETELLKAKLINIIEGTNNVIKACCAGNPKAAQAADGEIDKLYFDYRNEYAKIITGEDIPVINTSSGHFYARTEDEEKVFYALTSVEENKTVNNGYFSEEAQGKFIIAKLAILSNYNDALPVDSDSFYLLDRQGHKFSASFKGMTAVQIASGNTGGVLTELKPGVARECGLVFDVPEDAVLSDFDLHIDFKAQGFLSSLKIKTPLQASKKAY